VGTIIIIIIIIISLPMFLVDVCFLFGKFGNQFMAREFRWMGRLISYEERGLSLFYKINYVFIIFIIIVIII